MICHLRSLAFAVLVTPALHAQTSANTTNVADGSAVKTIVVPADEKLRAIVSDVQELHAKKQFFEALEKLKSAEALAPENPLIPNIRGSIYTGMRDFEKAKEAFEKAHTMLPDAFEPEFNLAELLYVQQRYAEAETAFAKIVEKHVKLREEVRHLAIFKEIVCELKLKKTAEAEKNAKAFSFIDDTPAYYFTKAAFFFAAENEQGGREWLGKATSIFKPAQNAVYIDSLMEAKWIPSLTVPDQAAPAKP